MTAAITAFQARPSTIEGNTFAGHQQFGNGTVAATIDNASGTFDADGSGNAFVFESGVVISNGGTMEATGGGALTSSATSAMPARSIDQHRFVDGHRPAPAPILGAISNATAATVTVSGALQLAGGTISGGTVTNSGSITTTTAGGAIDNATIDNSSGAITAGGELTLDDTTVNGGTLTGNSASSVFAVDHGDTLTLNGVTALGTSADRRARQFRHRHARRRADDQRHLVHTGTDRRRHGVGQRRDHRGTCRRRCLRKQRQHDRRDRHEPDRRWHGQYLTSITPPARLTSRAAR